MVSLIRKIWFKAVLQQLVTCIMFWYIEMPFNTFFEIFVVGLVWPWLGFQFCLIISIHGGYISGACEARRPPRASRLLLLGVDQV